MTEPTDEQRKNLHLTGMAFASFRPEAAEEMLALADPEVEVFASDELANPGSFHGHDGLMQWVGQWLDAWENYKVEVREIEPVGDRHVIARIDQSATGKGSGVPVKMEVTFMTEIRDGKYVALHLYPTKEEAKRIAEEREAAG